MNRFNVVLIIDRLYDFAWRIDEDKTEENSGEITDYLIWFIDIKE